MLEVYKQEWQRFKQNYVRTFIWVLIICVFFSTIFYIGLVNQPDEAMKLMDQVSEQIMKQADMLGSSLSDHPFDLFLFILKNNLLVTGLILLVGFIPFVVLPFIYSFTTVVSLVAVLAAVQVQGGSPLKVLAISILPHGVVEIIAMLLSSSIGIFLSLHIFKKMFSQKRGEIRLRSVIWQSVRSFLLLVLPLVFIAALIEGFITPVIIKAFV